MLLHPAMFALWIDRFGHDYNILKFILTTNNESLIWAVLHLLPLNNSQPIPVPGLPLPGTDFDIYAKLLGDKQQPIPELKKYPVIVQKQYASHPCWVRWAGIFDRKLSKEQRTMLIHYRTAFLCLLVNAYEDHAASVLSMAEAPQTLSVITREFLYSPEVISYVLLN